MVSMLKNMVIFMVADGDDNYDDGDHDDNYGEYDDDNDDMDHLMQL